MIYFILGAFFGTLVMFAARIADVNIQEIEKRYKTTKSFKKAKPIILDPEEMDKDQRMIDEILEGQE